MGRIISQIYGVGTDIFLARSKAKLRVIDYKIIYNSKYQKETLYKVKDLNTNDEGWIFQSAILKAVVKHDDLFPILYSFVLYDSQNKVISNYEVTGEVDLFNLMYKKLIKENNKVTEKKGMIFGLFSKEKGVE